MCTFPDEMNSLKETKLQFVANSVHFVTLLVESKTVKKLLSFKNLNQEFCKFERISKLTNFLNSTKQ